MIKQKRSVADMAEYNAMEEQYQEIRVLGKPALFHDMHLERDTVPKGLYLYEVRHDDCIGDPVQIARGIMVNHYGSILTCEPIKLPPDGYLDIDPEKDWEFGGGDCRTVEEFMEKYPPVKKKNRDVER